MSEENKTGENLVEQVEQEVVKSEEKPDFDVNAFMGDGTEVKTETVTEEKAEPKQEAKEEVKKSTKEESKEEVSEESSNDDFSWNSVEVETKEEPKKEEDWDSAEAPKAEEVKKEEEVRSPEMDWAKFSKELGMEAKDEKSFKEAFAKATEKPVTPNDTMNTLKGYLKMSDRNLVLEDLKASGLNEEEAKDTLVRIEDSGLLKREALQARKQIQNYITKETKTIKKKEADAKKAQEVKHAESRQELQGYLKQKGDFFGGKINNTEKKELYNYITSGDFANEVYSNHANVADAAFLWKYRNRIFKMLTGQGMERGKAAVLDKITNPDVGRKSRHVEITKKEGFDPVEFLK